MKKMKKMASGSQPKVLPEDKKFDARMMNDDESVKDVSTKLTRSMDKSEYPVGR